MEDHLPKIPMMASASPTESSVSGGTDDSRGKKFDPEEQQVIVAPFLFALKCYILHFKPKC